MGILKGDYKHQVRQLVFLCSWHSLAHWCPVYNLNYYCYWTFITSVQKRIKRHEANCRLNYIDNNIRESSWHQLVNSSLK